jgi:hypothetical protein
MKFIDFHSTDSIFSLFLLLLCRLNAFRIVLRRGLEAIVGVFIGRLPDFHGNFGAFVWLSTANFSLGLRSFSPHPS